MLLRRSMKLVSLALFAVASSASRGLAQGVCFDATFPTPWPAGAGPSVVRTGDLDGDGDVDIVASNGNTSGISVLFNQGGAAFAAPVPLTTAYSPVDLAVADLDNDGDLDLVALSRTPNGVSVLLNAGGGVFTPFVFYAVHDGPIVLTID